MRTTSILIALALASVLSLASSQAIAQDAPRVSTVLLIDAGGDMAKFQEFFKRAQAIGKQYGTTGTARVWVTTFAGPNTNSILVMNEFPSLVSMAQSQTKIGSSAEWQQFVADFQAAGMRVVSNSVIAEATP